MLRFQAEIGRTSSGCGGTRRIEGSPCLLTSVVAMAPAAGELLSYCSGPNAVRATLQPQSPATAQAIAAAPRAGSRIGRRVVAGGAIRQNQRLVVQFRFALMR